MAPVGGEKTIICIPRDVECASSVVGWLGCLRRSNHGRQRPGYVENGVNKSEYKQPY